MAKLLPLGEWSIFNSDFALTAAKTRRSAEKSRSSVGLVFLLVYDAFAFSSLGGFHSCRHGQERSC